MRFVIKYDNGKYDSGFDHESDFESAFHYESYQHAKNASLNYIGVQSILCIDKEDSDDSSDGAHGF